MGVLVSVLLAACFLRSFARADPPRADQLPRLEAGKPAGLLPLRDAQDRRWPSSVEAYLSEQILEDWDEDLAYGALESRVGVSLDYPLVNTRSDGTVVVPIVQTDLLDVRGHVTVPSGGGARRIVLLVDLSESSNQRTPVRGPSGGIEQISVREGAIRTALQLARRLMRERSEYGHLLDYRATELTVIGFGDQSWDIVPPGTDLPDAIQRLEVLAAKGMDGSGRSDAVCALRRAADWLATDGGTRRDVVLLTHGDLPFSNRFTDCSRHSDPRIEMRCWQELNRSECAAEEALDPERGHSDIGQLFALARETRPRIRIFPVLFQNTRPPRFIREIASHTGGLLIRVGQERGIESAVRRLLVYESPGLQVKDVAVRNLQSGVVRESAVEGDGASFACAIPLVAGPNDIEVDVRSWQGSLARYRFRVQAQSDPLSDFLAHVRTLNRDLEDRKEQVMERIAADMHSIRESGSLGRDLEIEINEREAKQP
jgi:hypothetical protein